MHKVDKHKV